ncbi:AEC family transporter [Ruminococcus gauvreauii]|uniref:AEC family transporter n=1 Tax=Ruminococcus gauvreauii TaxID=438033 RepID=A0ABY5VES9_9FIRM|nr:AEC family transporter [Ruminococcus gauvreauii]UWP58894.1 AEC family transporter [Ruminococcus gauvreauii]
MMSTWIVFQQMLVVFILIAVGFFMFRSGRFSHTASKDLSGLITNVCNPAIMIGSAFGDHAGTTGQDLLTAVLAAVVMYAVLLVLGWLLPRILRVSKPEQKFYSMMTVYGNIGFIGIPLVSAVLGSSALIYLSVFILMFNILIYTHGMQLITSDVQGGGFQWRRMINVGTISGMLTVIIFLLDPPVHQVISDSVSYIGGCTTFLSMLVLGGSIANMSAKEVFGDKKLYLFAAIRFFLIPAAAAVALKPLIANDLIREITVFCLAFPVANMPLMLAQEYNADTKLLARGIILTTLLSIFSVTLSAGFI